MAEEPGPAKGKLSCTHTLGRFDHFYFLILNVHDAKFLPTKYGSNIRAWLQNWAKIPDGRSCHLTLHVKYFVLQYAHSENTLACTQHTQTSYVQWYYSHFMVH